MQLKTILVTGAAGGIGWTVTQMLLKKGCQVVAIDDLTTGLARPELPGITWLNADIASPELPGKLSQYPIDGVVHCAARLADQSMAHPTADTKTNALGSIQLFEWAAGKRVQRVVFTSSSGVYGHPPARPIKESDPAIPATIYSVNKIACENYLRILENGYGLKWTVLRLFPTYGPSHKPSKTQGILNVMLTQLMEGNEVVVKGSLDRVRDLVYVEDTAQAIVESLHSDAAQGKIFNVSSGTSCTIKEMIYTIGGVLDRPASKVQIKELPGTPGDPMYNVADISLIRETIGFAPKFSLHEGIKRLVEARRLAKI